MCSLDAHTTDQCLFFTIVFYAEPCLPPDIPDDMTFDASAEPVENEWYLHGTSLHLACTEDGYTIDGPRELICEDGFWESSDYVICIGKNYQ